MPDFRFYIDERTMVWERTKVNIQATTYEEAVEIAKQLFNNGVDVDQFDPDYETLLDSQVVLTPEQNEGNPTRELLFVENGEQTILTNLSE